jgi:hypothetical protein
MLLRAHAQITQAIAVVRALDLEADPELGLEPDPEKDLELGLEKDQALGLALDLEKDLEKALEKGLEIVPAITLVTDRLPLAILLVTDLATVLRPVLAIDQVTTPEATLVIVLVTALVTALVTVMATALVIAGVAPQPMAALVAPAVGKLTLASLLEKAFYSTG